MVNNNLYILGPGLEDSIHGTQALSALKVFVNESSTSWKAGEDDPDGPLTYELYKDSSDDFYIKNTDYSTILWELTDEAPEFSITNPVGIYNVYDPSSTDISGKLYITDKLGKLTKTYTTDILRTWFKVRTKRKTGRQIKTNDTNFGVITGHWFLSGADTTGYDRRWYNGVTDEDDPSDGWLLYWDPYESSGPYPSTWAIKSLASDTMYYRGYPCDEDDGTKDVAWNPATGAWRGMHQGPCEDNPRGVYYSVHDSASGRVRLHDEYPNPKVFWNTHKSQTWTDIDDDNLIDGDELEDNGSIGSLIHTYTIGTTSVMISSTDVCGEDFNIVSNGTLKSQRDEGKRYTTGKTGYKPLSYIGSGNTHPSQRAITPAFGTGIRNTKHFPFIDDIDVVLNDVDTRRVKGNVGDSPMNTVNADGTELTLRSGSGTGLSSVTANNVLWLDADHNESFAEPGIWKDRSPSEAHCSINTAISSSGQFSRYKDSYKSSSSTSLSGRYVVSNVLVNPAAAYAFSMTNNDFDALSSTDSFSIFYVSRVPRTSNSRTDYLLHIGETESDKYYHPLRGDSDFGSGTLIGTGAYAEYIDIYDGINTGVTSTGQLSGSDSYIRSENWGSVEGGGHIAQGYNSHSDYYIRSIIFDNGDLHTYRDGRDTSSSIDQYAYDAYNDSITNPGLNSTIEHTKGYGILGKAGVGGLPANARLAELLIYDTDLDETNRQIVEGYLANKWNRTSKLIYDDHPYESPADPPEGYSANTPNLGLTSQYSVTSRYVDSTSPDFPPGYPSINESSEMRANSLFITNDNRVIFNDSNFNPNRSRLLAYDVVDDTLTEVCSLSSNATYDFEGTNEQFYLFRPYAVSNENNICIVGQKEKITRPEGGSGYDWGVCGLSSVQLPDSFDHVNHSYEDGLFYHGTIIARNSLPQHTRIISTSISEDGMRCMVGYRLHKYWHNNGDPAKYRVYEYDDSVSAWSTIGQELTGRHYSWRSQCKISGDGNRVIIAEPGNIDGTSTSLSTALKNSTNQYGSSQYSSIDAAASDSGAIDVYEFSGSEWTTVGEPISGSPPVLWRLLASGLSMTTTYYAASFLGAGGIDINYDGTVITGNEHHIYNHSDVSYGQEDRGRIRVWCESGGDWIQRGQDIGPGLLFGGLEYEHRLGFYSLKLNRDGSKLIASEYNLDSDYGDFQVQNCSFHVSKYDSINDIWINEHVVDPDRSGSHPYKSIDINETGDYIVASNSGAIDEVVLYKYSPSSGTGTDTTGSNFLLTYTTSDIYDVKTGLRKRKTLTVSPSSRNHLYFHTTDQTQQYPDYPFIVKGSLKTDGIFQTYTSQHTGILEAIFFKTSGCFTAGFTLTAHKGEFDADDMTSFTSDQKLTEVTVLTSDTQPYGKIEVHLDIPVEQGAQYIFEFGGDTKLVDAQGDIYPLHMYAMESTGISATDSGILSPGSLLPYTCGYIGTSNWPTSIASEQAWLQPNANATASSIDYMWTGLWFEAKVYDTVEEKTAICTYNGWKWDRMHVVWNTEYREYEDIGPK